MFRVFIRDDETEQNYSQDFQSENEAIDYATDCNFWKFNLILVQDEWENEILRFEN